MSKSIPKNFIPDPMINRYHLFAAAARNLLVGGLVIASTMMPVSAATITVFAAASLTPAMNAVAKAASAAGLGECRCVYGASSALARQIDAGAPADIFISANPKWMNYLADAGALEALGSIALLGNRLALVTPSDRTATNKLIAGAPLMRFLGDGRLAVGDPGHVPAGLYAKAALQSLGLWEAVRDRMVRSANVRAALALVERGEVSAGIVYETDAKSSDKVRMVGLFPETSHPPIIYPASIIAGHVGPATKRYMAYLGSDQAQRIFRAYGFVSRP